MSGILCLLVRCDNKLFEASLTGVEGRTIVATAEVNLNQLERIVERERSLKEKVCVVIDKSGCPQVSADDESEH